MENEQISQLLKDGIAAARAGEPVKARELLLQVVQYDRENEPAWLWLSGVADTDEDRRICLENVLVLNPNSNSARRGLDKLLAGLPADEESDPIQVVRREYEPLSLAQAILYPDRQNKEWQWNDRTPLTRSEKVSFRTNSKYDDVWERDSEICAYCAHEVEYDIERCPKCRRRLSTSSYRYPKASSDFYVYLVMLTGVAQAYFLLILVDVIIYNSSLLVVWHGFIFAIIGVLIAGIFKRNFWAYAASIVILLAIIIGRVLDTATDAALSSALIDLSFRTFFETMANNPASIVVPKLVEFIRSLQAITVFLALIYAVFRVGPDFERVKERQTAHVKKGMREAADYYVVGKDHAGAGRWASTVLHWQRAVALDPSRAYYQRILGQAYARLGFYSRSLDVLESARRISVDSGAREELDELIASVGSEMKAEHTTM
jgi:tetratricopeptide (TPR) repeat protein